MSSQSLKVQPRYQAVKKAYKSIQLEALGKSPVEVVLENQVKRHLMEIDLLAKIAGFSEEHVSR